jgi:broad specificity polyphosphatase/5'/3'-nucleotidase SurE
LLTEPGQLTAVNFLEDGRVEPDSDVKVVVVDKKISVTPLSFDLTSRVVLNDLERLLDGT